MNKATMISIFPDDEADVMDIIESDIIHLEGEHALGNISEEVFTTTVAYLNKYKTLLNG
jgi:hypothetical protein